MLDFFRLLFDTNGFPARWHCGTWTNELGWTHIISDAAIFGAYVAIPCVLGYFALRRRDVPFLPVFWLFAFFILSCGFGHFVEATIFWHPWYRFSGLVKVCTAVVSWATVIALIPVVPQALALPGLATANKQLETEIAERKRVEEQMQQQAQRLMQSYKNLESFSHSMVDREERVIELKREVNELLMELGKTRKYLGETSEI